MVENFFRLPKLVNLLREELAKRKIYSGRQKLKHVWQIIKDVVCNKNIENKRLAQNTRTAD